LEVVTAMGSFPLPSKDPLNKGSISIFYCRRRHRQIGGGNRKTQHQCAENGIRFPIWRPIGVVRIELAGSNEANAPQ
jgi:hypothetical protein